MAAEDPYSQMVLDRWYNNDDACKWLRLKHQQVYGNRFKNPMERFVQKIKDRTAEYFDDHFPCTKNDCNRLHVYNWLKLYILYIHTDMDDGRNLVT